MVIFDKQETGLCFTKGGRIYFYTDVIDVWLFIHMISNTYFCISNYTEVLKIVRDRGPDIPNLLTPQALKASLKNLQIDGAFSSELKNLVFVSPLVWLPE
jgi:hypothetical protein